MTAQFENLRFERISAIQGLPNCNIEHAIEDHYGYLWFATCEGVFQYDGYEFKDYRHDVTDSTSLSDPYVYSVYEDKEKNIWACTANGLSLLDRRTGKFQTFKPNPEDKKTKVSNHVRQAFEDSRGNFWVDSNKNLLRFDRKTKQFTRLLQEGDPEKYHAVRQIIEDNQGSIWAGTTYGLLKVNSGDSTFQFILPNPNPESPFNQTIKTIFEEEDGMFLMATFGGLLKWNPRTHEISDNFLPPAFKPLQVDYLTTDRQGNYWVSFYKKGIAVYDLKERKFHEFVHKPYQLNSLSDNEVSWILEDRFRNIWVCTKNNTSIHF